MKMNWKPKLYVFKSKKEGIAFKEILQDRFVHSMLFFLCIHHNGHYDPHSKTRFNILRRNTGTIKSHTLVYGIYIYGPNSTVQSTKGFEIQ